MKQPMMTSRQTSCSHYPNPPHLPHMTCYFHVIHPNMAEAVHCDMPVPSKCHVSVRSSAAGQGACDSGVAAVPTDSSLGLLLPSLELPKS